MTTSFHDRNLLMDFVAYLRINGMTSVSMADEKNVIERYLEVRFGEAAAKYVKREGT
jgi:hypothetical protein